MSQERIPGFVWRIDSLPHSLCGTEWSAAPGSAIPPGCRRSGRRRRHTSVRSNFLCHHGLSRSRFILVLHGTSEQNSALPIIPTMAWPSRGCRSKNATKFHPSWPEVLTAAKFLPFGILVPLRAGAIEIGPWRFVLVDAVCSLFYASVYVLPGLIFHGQLEQLVKGVRRFGAFTFVCCCSL